MGGEAGPPPSSGHVVEAVATLTTCQARRGNVVSAMESPQPVSILPCSSRLFCVTDIRVKPAPLGAFSEGARANVLSKFPLQLRNPEAHFSLTVEKHLRARRVSMNWRYQGATQELVVVVVGWKSLEVVGSRWKICDEQLEELFGVCFEKNRGKSPVVFLMCLIVDRSELIRVAVALPSHCWFSAALLHDFHENQPATIPFLRTDRSRDANTTSGGFLLTKKCSDRGYAFRFMPWLEAQDPGYKLVLACKCILRAAALVMHPIATLLSMDGRVLFTALAMQTTHLLPIALFLMLPIYLLRRWFLYKLW